MPCTGGANEVSDDWYRALNHAVQGTANTRASPCNNFSRFMYYVYVLLSGKDNNFYIGFSENIEQRLDEHNAGKNVSTRERRPFTLIYHEGHISKSDALRREEYFKTSKGKTTLKQILRDALRVSERALW